MTAVQIIQTICSALADSPSLSSYVQMARESLDRCFFGKMYEYAVAYKACHLFTLFESNSDSSSVSNVVDKIGGGQITGITEGGLSINFAQLSGDAQLNDLALTKYGKMLLALMRSGVRMNVNRFI